MANKSNNTNNAASSKRKSTANNSSNSKKKQQDDAKDINRPTTAYDDIESLQITFYEIESWIEKTTPILSRMTKELDRASGHFDHSKRRKAAAAATASTSTSVATSSFCHAPIRNGGVEVVDQHKLEQQLLQLQQQQLLWKRSMLINNGESSSSTSATTTAAATTKNDSMQWLLSFQPGNLLRLDTNITSVEQLIEAVQKIRLLQAEEAPIVEEKEQPEEEMAFNLTCSSPASSSSAATSSQADVSYVEYWFNAIGRRPKIELENYKHCRMNLNLITKNISPAALNYIGQVHWDCLHPKISTDWASFWEREGLDAKRNQVCIDSGLAMIFLHITRHDKDICPNAQEVAGFYYDRARDELMEFFDDPPDCASIEALLNLSMFCIVCKRYSQSRIYIGLCLHMVLECGLHKLVADKSKTTIEDLIQKKKYFSLLLNLYFNDFNLAAFTGETALIDDKQINIDFYQLISINEHLVELNKTAEVINLDNGKSIVKDAYIVHTVELGKISKRTLQLIAHGATKKELLAQEKALTVWLSKIPDSFKQEMHDYDHHERRKIQRDHAIEKDIATVVDAKTLEAQAALMLKIQYEAQWIILHKAVLNSIRNPSSSPPPSPQQQLDEETRSNNICSNSADAVVAVAEVVSRCFGWCVCQQIVTPIYHASTVYCGQALVKNNPQLRNKAKEMIHRIMRVLDAGGANHEGFPDDMTECLCEFLTNHGMHNGNVECSCSVDIDQDQHHQLATFTAIPTLGPLDGAGIVENGMLPPTHKHLKKLKHITRMVIDDSSSSNNSSPST